MSSCRATNANPPKKTPLAPMAPREIEVALNSFHTAFSSDQAAYSFVNGLDMCRFHSMYARYVSNLIRRDLLPKLLETYKSEVSSHTMYEAKQWLLTRIENFSKVVKAREEGLACPSAQ